MNTSMYPLSLSDTLLKYFFLPFAAQQSTGEDEALSVLIFLVHFDSK